jgi:hypothetical protein
LQRPLLGNYPPGESDCPCAQITLRDFVDDAVVRGLGGADRLTGDDHPQRLFGADEPRQSLGSAGTGQQAELDLG